MKPVGDNQGYTNHGISRYFDLVGYSLLSNGVTHETTNMATSEKSIGTNPGGLWMLIQLAVIITTYISKSIIPYQVPGTVRGLYFLYLIFHSITSLHLWHTLDTRISFTAFNFSAVPYLSFLNDEMLLCFWARCFLIFPRWELIFYKKLLFL